MPSLVLIAGHFPFLLCTKIVKIDTILFSKIVKVDTFPCTKIAKNYTLPGGTPSVPKVYIWDFLNFIFAGYMGRFDSGWLCWYGISLLPWILGQHTFAESPESKNKRIAKHKSSSGIKTSYPHVNKDTLLLETNNFFLIYSYFGWEGRIAFVA